MRRAAPFLASAAVALWAGSSPASEGRVGPSPELLDRVGVLSRWIADNSDYEKAPALAPIFIWLSPPELRYLESGDFTEAGQAQREHVPLAIYSNRVMFLHEDFDLVRDDQILMHELVHHFQWANGRTYPCVGAQEKEAYELQQRYADYKQLHLN